MSLPRWLRPRHPLAGLLFGYLVGNCAWIALLASFTIKDGQIHDVASLFSEARYGLLWAIPWAVLWCFSGALAYGALSYPATVVTLLGMASGAMYSLTASTFDGWQALTIPFYVILHFVLWHAAAILLYLAVMAIRGVED